MTRELRISGREPQIGASSPDNRRNYVVVDGEDSSPILTGLEPELGGHRRVLADPRLIAYVLTADTPEAREHAVGRILDEGRAGIYASELAKVAAPGARRRIAGLWNRRYTPRQRVNAIAAVGMLGYASPHTIKPLFTAMGSKDRAIMRAALIALSDIWRMDDLWQLTHTNPLQRQHAAENLARRGDPRAIGPLLVSLEDEDAYVRASIAQALGQLGAHHAIDDLLGLLEDSDLVVRRSAAEALGTIVANLAPDDENARAVVNPMLHVLRNGTWVERQAAAQALGHLGDTDRAVVPLLTALHDRDRLVREAAARALGMLGDGRALKPLIGLIDDVNYAVAQAAVQALGELRDARAVPHLLLIMQEDPDLSLTAAHALGQIGDPAAVEPLTTIAHSNQQRYAVREAAQLALRRISTATSASTLGERRSTNDN